jgi:hypothetical protein
MNSHLDQSGRYSLADGARQAALERRHRRTLTTLTGGVQDIRATRPNISPCSETSHRILIQPWAAPVEVIPRSRSHHGQQVLAAITPAPEFVLLKQKDLPDFDTPTIM